MWRVSRTCLSKKFLLNLYSNILKNLGHTKVVIVIYQPVTERTLFLLHPGLLSGWHRGAGRRGDVVTAAHGAAHPGDRPQHHVSNHVCPGLPPPSRHGPPTRQEVSTSTHSTRVADPDPVLLDSQLSSLGSVTISIPIIYK